MECKSRHLDTVIGCGFEVDLGSEKSARQYRRDSVTPFLKSHSLLGFRIGSASIAPKRDRLRNSKTDTKHRAALGTF